MIKFYPQELYIHRLFDIKTCGFLSLNKKETIMRFVSGVILLILSVHHAYAQNIYQQPPQTKNNDVVTDPNNIESKPKQTESDPTITERKITQKDNTPTNTNQRQILGRYSIFPESQIKNTVNPVFQRETFSVNDALKGNIQQFKSSESYGGTNSQFKKVPKEIDEKDIPAEFRGLLKK